MTEHPRMGSSLNSIFQTLSDHCHPILAHTQTSHPCTCSEAVLAFSRCPSYPGGYPVCANDCAADTAGQYPEQERIKNQHEPTVRRRWPEKMEGKVVQTVSSYHRPGRHLSCPRQPSLEMGWRGHA